MRMQIANAHCAFGAKKARFRFYFKKRKNFHPGVCENVVVVSVVDQIVVVPVVDPTLQVVVAQHGEQTGIIIEKRGANGHW